MSPILYLLTKSALNHVLDSVADIPEEALRMMIEESEQSCPCGKPRCDIECRSDNEAFKLLLKFQQDLGKIAQKYVEENQLQDLIEE